MNRKQRIVIALAIIIAVAGGLLTKTCLVGSLPLQELRAEDVESVSLSLLPPDLTIELTREEIQEVIPLLNEVRVYNRSLRYQFSGGQDCIYTLTFSDGTELTAKTLWILHDHQRQGISGRVYAQ